MTEQQMSDIQQFQELCEARKQEMQSILPNHYTMLRYKGYEKKIYSKEKEERRK